MNDVKEQVISCCLSKYEDDQDTWIPGEGFTGLKRKLSVSDPLEAAEAAMLDADKNGEEDDEHTGMPEPADQVHCSTS